MTLIETFMEARLFITGFLVMAAGTFIWWLWYERRNRKLIESGGTETTATVERYRQALQAPQTTSSCTGSRQQTAMKYTG